MSKFQSKGGFKWIGPKGFVLNRYTSESLEGCIFEVQLEYPKELRELHDYLLAPQKMEIKENNLPIYQFKKADIYNIPIGSVKTLMSIFFFFLMKESMSFVMRTYNFIWGHN